MPMEKNIELTILLDSLNKTWLSDLVKNIYLAII